MSFFLSEEILKINLNCIRNMNIDKKTYYETTGIFRVFSMWWMTKIVF